MFYSYLCIRSFLSMLFRRNLSVLCALTCALFFFQALEGANFVARPSSISHLDDTTFYQAISKQIVVVDFYADWCPPCRKLSPIFEEVAAEMGDQALFAKVNIDKAKKVAKEHQVESIPTLIIFKNGKEEKRHKGGCDAETLRNFVRSAL